MAKLTIGNAPATFPLLVTVKTPTGEAEINLVAKHLPMTQWAAMRDKHTEDVDNHVKAIFEDARKAAEAEHAKKVKKADDAAPALTDEEKETAIAKLIKMPKQAVLAGIRSKFAAELIEQVSESWDLDDALSRETLQRMCDLYPDAGPAIFSKYGEVLEGRRLGN